jgi:hypothetical protein
MMDEREKAEFAAYILKFEANTGLPSEERNRSAKSKDNGRDTRQIRLVVASFILTVLLTATGIVATQFFRWDNGRLRSGTIPVFDSTKFATASDVERLQSSAYNADRILKAAINSVGKPYGAGIQIAEFAALKESVTLIGERLSVLEKSIADNPEKALSIPMLRKDQENMAKAIEQNKLSLNVELARIYDQQKWMLGGIGTVLLAAVTALLSVLYKMVFKTKDAE